MVARWGLLEKKGLGEMKSGGAQKAVKCWRVEVFSLFFC